MKRRFHGGLPTHCAGAGPIQPILRRAASITRQVILPLSVIKGSAPDSKGPFRLSRALVVLQNRFNFQFFEIGTMVLFYEF
jgi:hypothetical protein